MLSEWKQEVRRRLAGLGLEPWRENEIVEELAQHLEDRYRELLAARTSEEQARSEVLDDLCGDLLARRLDSVEGAVFPRTVLGSRRRNMMGDLLQDLQFGTRMLRKNPGFGLVVLITIAVGIGANTAIFTVVNAVMLRPLPFADSDRLVRLYESNPERGWPQFAISHPNFLDWRAQNQSFESMAATSGASVTVSTGDEVEVIRGSVVTADFLPTLKVSPHLGRNFLPEEDRPGGNRVVLLTHGFWQRRLGGDPDVLEKQVTLSNNPFTVVGVLPQSFNWGGPDLELLLPLAPDPNRSRSDHRLVVIGRLKADVSLEQALTDMNALADRLAEQYPDSNRGWSVTGLSFYHWIVPEASRRALVVFLVAVAVVLLIACSNVANLLLARASTRGREIAIRLAMGASRSRIMRQLLAESLLLGVIGGALGVGLSVLIVRGIKSMNPDNLPRLDEVSLDGRVLLFALGISLLTGVIFGMAPAIQASRPNLNETLKEGGRSGAGGARRQRVRSILVVVEVALSVMLLAGAGLLMRSFAKLQDVNPGFAPDKLLTGRISLPRNRYNANEPAVGFYDRLLSELMNSPGIVSAGIISMVPMDGGNTSSEVSIPGRPPAPDGTKPSAEWRIISPGYFRTMGIPLRGRDFDERDTVKGQPVTIISEEMARQNWPGEDVIGKTVVLHSFGDAPRTIIGVAGDVRSQGLDLELRPGGYAPLAIAALWNPMSLVVRTETDPTTNATTVREAVKRVDANVPFYTVRTVDEVISDSLGARRFNMFLLVSFAAAALLLSCVGLFGVMAYLVSQRTHEIGIRLALGARRGDVFRLVVGRGMLLATAGSVAGVAAAFWLVRLITSFIETLLFQVKPNDLMAFAIAPLVLLGVSLLACYVPARRATKVDPLTALRYE